MLDFEGLGRYAGTEFPFLTRSSLMAADAFDVALVMCPEEEIPIRDEGCRREDVEAFSNGLNASAVACRR